MSRAAPLPAGRRRRSRARRFLVLLAGSVLVYHLAFAVLNVIFPFPHEVFDRYGVSPVVYAADGTPMHVGLTTAGERLWPCEEHAISEHVRHAAIAMEDRRFFQHGGVDAWAVLRAAWSNLTDDGERQGASTIPMQLARLLDPQPRTFAGKTVQAFRALQLERSYPKHFLLARYLDLVPFAGNVRGIGAAAKACFGKDATYLTAAEAALLVSMLPAPTRFAPWKNAERSRTRRNRILDAMRREGYLDAAAHAAACEAPLGIRRTPFPDLAPHAWLRVEEGVTSIDPTTQRAVESILRTMAGPAGVAAVVVDNRTMAVRALAGAARPDAALLDASRRPRSAGSTLKPFLYALALDRGLLTLETRLLDLPWQSRDWSPSNFDQHFRGPVPARDALAASLNVPAVRLAAALPRSAFLATLRQTGFRHLRPHAVAKDVDLALGTDDITAMELAGAYAMLANGGRYRPPWISAAERTPGSRARRVLSEGAAALVTEALADPRRVRPAGAAREGVAWKTGTSSNRRDAWAAGGTSDTTVVVWRGCLDGRSDPDLVGARAATPLFFAVLHAADPSPRPRAALRGTVEVELCAESGLRATGACARTTRGRVPADASPLRSCTVHRHLLVDTASGDLCCAACRARHAVEERTFEVFPPAWAAWRARTGQATSVVPPHAADCAAPLDPVELGPVFVRPLHGQRLGAEGGAARVDVEVLVGAGEGPVTLLVDGVPAGRLEGGERRSIVLVEGRHRLTATTSRVLHASVDVRVEPED